MTNLEQAAAAAVAAWERDGARYDTFCQRMDALRDALAAHKDQAEPVVAVQTEPAALTHDEVQRLAAQAGLPRAWISETGVIQWSQLERLIALARQQAEPVVDTAQCDGGQCGVGGYCKTCPKQQAEPVAEAVRVTDAMVEAAEAAHDAARDNRSGFWRSAVPAMLTAALAAQQQAEPVFEIGFGWLVDGRKYPKGTKLYAAPPEQKQAEPGALFNELGGRMFSSAKLSGCQTCGIDAVKVMGYVCPRGDCPTQVRSGTHEQS